MSLGKSSQGCAVSLTCADHVHEEAATYYEQVVPASNLVSLT